MPSGATIGRHTYNVTWNSFYGCTDEAPVTIGPFCSIAKEVLFICSGEHRMNTAATFPLGRRVFSKNVDPMSIRSKGPIIVGPDVWIGRRAVVLSGIEIGAGAIVGAGSVVTKDIPPYALAAGNPARVVRMRFSQDIIDEMMAIAWWDWPEEKLRGELSTFDLPMSEFVSQHCDASGDTVR